MWRRTWITTYPSLSECESLIGPNSISEIDGGRSSLVNTLNTKSLLRNTLYTLFAKSYKFRCSTTPNPNLGNGGSGSWSGNVVMSGMNGPDIGVFGYKWRYLMLVNNRAPRILEQICESLNRYNAGLLLFQMGGHAVNGGAWLMRTNTLSTCLPFRAGECLGWQ